MSARENTRTAVRHVLGGHPPNGISPESCGRYADKIQGLYEAYSTGQTAGARRYWSHVCQMDPDLARLTSSDSKLDNLNGFTARELQLEDLPDPVFVVDGVLPEGTSLLVSPPKVGKTLLAQNVSIAIATEGKALGKIRVRGGTVLFLALEGSKRGLQRRLRMMIGEEPWPDRLHFYREWKSVDDGGLDLIREFARAHPDTRLVIIDTLKRIRGKGNAHRNAYDEDYEALQPIAALGEELGISFLIIHHTNKRDGGDVMDLVSGSTGLTAAVDNVLIMQKERGQIDAKLTVIPREEEEQELALSFDQSIATWILEGDASEIAKTSERQQIVNVLRDAGGPLKTGEIASAVKKKTNAVSYLLKKLEASGMVKSASYGQWVYSGTETPESTETSRERFNGSTPEYP